MTQASDDLQRLWDRGAIHDLIARYFYGLDREKPDQVRSCFSEDVTARYHGRPPTIGVDALMKGISIWKRRQAGELKATTHFMGNLNIHKLKPDFAETETYAIACIVLARKPTDVVTMRSLRYLDRLRRLKDGWRISERTHTLDWSCEVPVTFVATATQRIAFGRDF